MINESVNPAQCSGRFNSLLRPLEELTQVPLDTVPELIAASDLDACDWVSLGGTFDRDDWSLNVNKEQSDWILNNHIEIMKGLKNPI